MSGDGSRKTILDLSITIPNTKSSSSLKLSDYINIDERLQESLKDVTFFIQRGLFINITIKGEIYDTIDSNRFVRSLKKLESKTGCKWKGDLELHYTFS